ncbi:MAG: HD domain-containing protein [Oscillospiraceae bacterium]
MTREHYQSIENYMRTCATDSAHDTEHIYRVLYVALDIARYEKDVDMDILITACLLHDVGRPEQYADPAVCHALVGSEKAYAFLLTLGWDAPRAQRAKDCISTHRYRSGRPPESVEAKILFDADKIDATGTLGIARTILYRTQGDEPLYTFLPDGTVSDGSADREPSFFQEYKFKLEKLYDRFYTTRGKEIAASRRSSAVAFYDSMLKEVKTSYEPGVSLLNQLLEEA